MTRRQVAPVVVGRAINAAKDTAAGRLAAQTIPARMRKRVCHPETHTRSRNVLAFHIFDSLAA